MSLKKYRVIQDSLYESDFDKLMNDMERMIADIYHVTKQCPLRYKKVYFAG